MQRSLIPAFGSAATFAGGIGVPILIPQAPSWVGWGLIGLAFVLLALAAGLWIAAHPQASNGDAGISQDSRGSHSPNIGNVGGDFHYHPPAEKSDPAPAPRRPPMKITQAALEAAGRPSWAPPPPPLKPDFPMKALNVRLYKIRGGMPTTGQTDFVRGINREILDKMEHDGLALWARRNDGALKLLDGYDREHGKIDHFKNEFRIPVAYGHDSIVEDLHFNRSQVDRIWPNRDD